MERRQGPNRRGDVEDEDEEDRFARQHRLRVEITARGHPRDGERLPAVDFRFLRWNRAGPEPSVDARWRAMSQYMQMVFRRIYPMYLNTQEKFQLELQSEDGSLIKQFPTSLGNIRAPYLLAAFSVIEHYPTGDGGRLQLDEVMIHVAPLAENMQIRRGGGRGRPFGSNSIPKRLKTLGLGTHPKLAQDPVARARGLCGPIALLMAYDHGYYKDHYDALISDAENLGRIMELPSDGFMRNCDIDVLLEHDSFVDHRVLVFNPARILEYANAGVAWEPNVDRSKDDEMTLVILRDGSTQHYWWVQYVQRLLGRKNRPNERDKKKFCFGCYKMMQSTLFDAHVCDSLTVHQCQICLMPFGSVDSLMAHERMKGAGWSCEICKRDVFCGVPCFYHHHSHSCRAVGDVRQREWCEDCNRWYLLDFKDKHCCVDFGQCSNCEVEFTSGLEKRAHRCCMQRNSDFWDPLHDKKGFPCWNSHWGYDFETGVVADVHPDEKYKRHEVVAWAVQLCDVDEATRDYLDGDEVLGVLAGDTERLKVDYPDVEYSHSRNSWFFYARGRTIYSFLAFTTKVACRKKKGSDIPWKPTFWAHNGAKYDVKFISDHYVNELNYGMAGGEYCQVFGDLRTPDCTDGTIKWKVKKIMQRSNVLRISAISGKFLQVKADGVRYQDTMAHLSGPLAGLPKTFGLDLSVKKGHFPYSLIRSDAWGSTYIGMPPLSLFDVDSLSSSKRLETVHWYIHRCFEQRVDKLVLLNDLVNCGVDSSDYTACTGWKLYSSVALEGGAKLWNYDEELWDYLAMDVAVLVAALKAYHQSVVELHTLLPTADGVTADPELFGKMVSPLDSMTLPGYCLKFWKTWFMPVVDMTLLRQREALFVKASLSGGRCDKGASYCFLTKANKLRGDRIRYVDFVSLYPSVMQCDVHGTHYPVGPPRWIQSLDCGECDNERIRTLVGGATGFVRVDVVPRKYTPVPTLHHVVPDSVNKRTMKLVFDNVTKTEKIYCWPELEEAIDSGEVDVVRLHDGLLFERSSDVFDGYIKFFYKVKADATRTGNKGLRANAKLSLNSLWGKLGQRSYATNELVTDATRKDYLLTKIGMGDFELVNMVERGTTALWVEYREKVDRANLNNTLYHLASFTSMWGRVMLHRKILNVHGERVLYMDTDSAVVYLPAGVGLDGLGSDLGDLADECDKILEDRGLKKGLDFDSAYIDEFVALCPKTYGFRIVSEDGRASTTKVVHKGLEGSHANSRTVHLEAMKALAFWANDGELFHFLKRKGWLKEKDAALPPLKRICDGGRERPFSGSRPDNLGIKWTHSAKAITGAYGKGIVHPKNKCLVARFHDFGKEPPGGTFMDGWV